MADHSVLPYFTSLKCVTVIKEESESILCPHLADAPNNTSVSVSGPAEEGSSVTLSCDTDSNPAADSYTWYRVGGGHAVTEAGSEKTLSAAVSEDDSQFYCRASNRYGSQNSSVAQIDVLCESSKQQTTNKQRQQAYMASHDKTCASFCSVPPKDTTVVVNGDGPLVEGSAVALLCRSRANPPASNYTWYKDERQVGEAGPSLLLASMEPSHAGHYRCSAGNQLGETLSPPAQLDVQCKSVFFLRHSGDIHHDDDTQTCLVQLYCTSSCAHSDVDPGQVSLSGAQTVAELSCRLTTCEPPALPVWSGPGRWTVFFVFFSPSKLVFTLLASHANAER